MFDFGLWFCRKQATIAICGKEAVENIRITQALLAEFIKKNCAFVDPYDDEPETCGLWFKPCVLQILRKNFITFLWIQATGVIQID